MAREVESLDIDAEAMPDLARLAREVAHSGRPCVLRENGEDLAIITPATANEPSNRIEWKKPTPEQIEATLATFGGWDGLVDPENLKRTLREGRSDHRPPVEL